MEEQKKRGTVSGSLRNTEGAAGGAWAVSAGTFVADTAAWTADGSEKENATILVLGNDGCGVHCL